MIKIDDLNYSYDNKIKALNHINLEILKGDSVAFIGPNGSGKSTLLKLLNGLVFSQSGKYHFNSEEINEKKLHKSDFSKAFHSKIGFVFQNSEVQLFCSKVSEEIAFGLRQMNFNSEEIDKRVFDVAKLLNIENLMDREPYHLSGGEKKKVAIASVLAMNPMVLVLDEPLNGLDPKTKRFIRELLIKLNEGGKTILCSTHDFHYVQGVFKRAVVFGADHKIIRDGDYEEIINDVDFLEKNNIL